MVSIAYHSPARHHCRPFGTRATNQRAVHLGFFEPIHDISKWGTLERERRSVIVMATLDYVRPRLHATKVDIAGNRVKQGTNDTFNTGISRARPDTEIPKGGTNPNWWCRVNSQHAWRTACSVTLSDFFTWSTCSVTFISTLTIEECSGVSDFGRSFPGESFRCSVQNVCADGSLQRGPTGNVSKKDDDGSAA